MISKELLDASTVTKVNIKGRAEINYPDYVNIRITEADGNVIQIPADELNTDYKTYLEWISDGNSPDSEIDE